MSELGGAFRLVLLLHLCQNLHLPVHTGNSVFCAMGVGQVCDEFPVALLCGLLLPLGLILPLSVYV